MIGPNPAGNHLLAVHSACRLSRRCAAQWLIRYRDLDGLGYQELVVAATVTTQQFQLDGAKRMQVRIAPLERMRLALILAHQIRVTGDLEVDLAGALKFLGYQAKNAVCGVLVVDQVGLQARQLHLRLSHDLRHVGEDRAEERPRTIQLAQLLPARCTPG